MPPYKPKADPKEINRALLYIKQALTSNNFIFLESREKNLKTLSHFGIVTQNVYDIILELTYKNYCNGPTDDRDFPQDTKSIWEFGYILDSEEIYIKIKIERLDRVIGISFHIADRPLYFHYK